jgi:hypothetical protein
MFYSTACHFQLATNYAASIDMIGSASRSQRRDTLDRKIDYQIHYHYASDSIFFNDSMIIITKLPINAVSPHNTDLVVGIHINSVMVIYSLQGMRISFKIFTKSMNPQGLGSILEISHIYFFSI